MKYLIKRCKVVVTSIVLAGVMAGVVSSAMTPESASAVGFGLYSVYQEGVTIGAYESRDVAIREAKKWANSEVKQSGSVVWAFTDTLYKVYQGGQCLGAYSSKDVAIRESNKWSNSEVKQNGSVVWSLGSSSNTSLNDGLYRVYQGRQCLGAYSNKDVAISESNKWAQSEVRQNNSVVWKFGDKVSNGSNWSGGGSSSAIGSGKIKGNHSSSGEKIYHVPGGQYYNKTVAEEYFNTEEDARAAGYRKSKR